MVHYILLAVILAFGSGEPEGKKLKCKDLKTGQFRTLDEKKKEERYIVTRTADTQTEYDEKDGTTVKLKITWTGECTYYLEHLEGDEEGKNSDKKLFVEIVKIEGKMYKYSAHFEGEEDTKYKGWVKKID